MNEAEGTHSRIRKPTLVLIIAGACTLLLAVTVGIVYLSRPQPVVIEISGPSGTVVLSDLVIDGRADEHRDTVPVTYTYVAETVRFAVIPESADADKIRVDVSSGHGGGTVDAAGVTGAIQHSGWGGRSRLGRMSDRHIANMRSARLADDVHGDAKQTPAKGNTVSAERQAVPEPTGTTADQ